MKVYVSDSSDSSPPRESEELSSGSSPASEHHSHRDVDQILGEREPLDGMRRGDRRSIRSGRSVRAGAVTLPPLEPLGPLEFDHHHHRYMGDGNA